MFEHVAVGVEPVVVDLTAEHVTADSPLRRAFARLQVGVAAHQIVEVGHLERGMVEPGTTDTDEEQRVVIDVALTLVTPEKRTQRMSFIERDLIGGHQPEALFVPGLTGAEVEHVEHAMPEPLHMRRAGLEPNRRADPDPFGRIVARRRAGKREPPDRPASGDDLDLEPVGINGANNATASRSGEITNRGEAVHGRQVGQLVLARDLEREADEPRFVAEMGHMDEAFVVAPPHVERRVVATRTLHAELGEERFHHVEVGSAEPDERDVLHLHGHGVTAVSCGGAYPSTITRFVVAMLFRSASAGAYSSDS